MKIIGCGIVSLTLIYLGVAPVCKSLAYLFALLIKRKNGELFHTLTQVFFIFICITFGGFGWIYFCFATRKISLSNQLSIESIQAQFQFESVKLSKKVEKLIIIILLFITSVLILAQNVLQAYMGFTFDVSQGDKKSNLKYELFVLNIFYLCILSYFILHYSLYRHQVISLIIIIIGMLLILFPNIIYEKYLEFRLPLYFLEYLLSSLRYVLEKYLMETKFMSAYQILLLQGLISICLCIILGFILEGISSWKNMFGSSMIMFQEIGYAFLVEPLKVCLEFVFTVIYYLSAMLIKYYYTPMHCSVTALLTSLIMWIFVIYEGKLINENIAQVAVGYVFFIFGLLLYIEIIICYAWGLHVNTKKEIELRGKYQENCAIGLSAMLNSEESSSPIIE